MADLNKVDLENAASILAEMADWLHEAARRAGETFGKQRDVTLHLRKAEQQVRWAAGSLETEVACREQGLTGPLAQR